MSLKKAPGSKSRVWVEASGEAGQGNEGLWVHTKNWQDPVLAATVFKTNAVSYFGICVYEEIVPPKSIIF